MTFLKLLGLSRPVSRSVSSEHSHRSAATRKHRRHDIDFKARLEFLENRICPIQQILPAPIITWPNPAPIAFGTPLGPTQLDATVILLEYTDIEGDTAAHPDGVSQEYPIILSYTLADGTTPANGAVLPVGQNETLNVTVSSGIPSAFAFGTIANGQFTGYITPKASASITVNPAGVQTQLQNTNVLHKLSVCGAATGRQCVE